MATRVRSFCSIAMFVALLISCNNSDLIGYGYENYSEAERDGAFDRGAIPRFLPTSAYEIQAKQDVDSNELWVTFRFLEHPDSSIASACTVVETLEEELPRPRTTRGIDWWPSRLIRGTAQPLDEYQLLECPLQIRYAGRLKAYEAFLALNDSEKRGWYWSLGD